VDDLLAELFSSKVRAAVLGHVLPRPDRGFSLTDLSRRLDLPVSSLQHECYKLERIGVLFARRAGNARLYRIVPTCPILAPLTRLIVTAIGPVAALAAAIDGVPGLESGFLAGTLPTEAGESASDAPPRLVLIGDIALDELDTLLVRAETALGVVPGTLELAFFRPDDWQSRLADANPYVLGLVNRPRVDLIEKAPIGR
jgi:hypothetical protein